VFRGHGLHISQSGKKLPKIIVRSLILLLFGTVLLVAPLGNELAKEVRKGQSRPLAFPVSRDVSNAINERVNLEKGVQLAIIARAGVARAVDVGIFLTAEKPVDSNFISDLKHIVSQKMGKKILTKVVIFQAGEVKKAIVKQKKEQ
jgi:hypothetical protein